MGIVICILIAFSIIFLDPFANISALKRFGGVLRTKKLSNFIGVAIFIGGVWNAFWYGIAQLNTFWGGVAFLSGILMILAAMKLLFLKYALVEKFLGSKSIFQQALSFSLLGFFLLYLITIISLNIGLPIIS